MSDAYKKLAQKVVDNAAPDTIYTVPGSTEAIIRNIKVVNTGGAPTTIRLWHDGSAQANVILPPVTLNVNDFGVYTGVITMEAGDTLVAQAGAANSITITVYGLEVS